MHSTLEELRAFITTGWAFIRRPKRFGEDWAKSAVPRLNPFAFMATSLAIVGTTDFALSRLFLHVSHDDAPLWAIVRDSLTPYADGSETDETDWDYGFAVD